MYGACNIFCLSIRPSTKVVGQKLFAPFCMAIDTEKSGICTGHIPRIEIYLSTWRKHFLTIIYCLHHSTPRWLWCLQVMWYISQCIQTVTNQAMIRWKEQFNIDKQLETSTCGWTFLFRSSQLLKEPLVQLYCEKYLVTCFARVFVEWTAGTLLTDWVEE